MHLLHFFTSDDFTAWHYRLCDSLYGLDQLEGSQSVILHPCRKLQARLERMGISHHVVPGHSRKPAFIRRRALAKWVQDLQGDAALLYGAGSAQSFAAPLKRLKMPGLCLLAPDESRPRLPGTIQALHYAPDDSDAGTIHPPVWAQTAGEPVTPEEMATPPRAPVLGIYGRIQSAEPLLPVLDALACLPDHYLWVGGEGPGIAKAHQYSQQLDLEERVRFCGETIERDAFLKSIDALLVPPGDAGNMFIIPQAWAHGTPVISAANEADALIADGENALSLNENTADNWQNAIQRITDDNAAFAKQLIKGGLKAYDARFRPERFAEKLAQNFFKHNITQ